MKTIMFFFISALLIIVTPSFSLSLTMLKGADENFSLPSSRFNSSIFVGNYSDEAHKSGALLTTLRTGFDLPFFSVIGTNIRELSFGIAPLVHMYLFPKNSSFHVDNFFVILPFYLATCCNENTTLRLYPLYHISAHLSDGAIVDIKTERKKVSNEMLFITLSRKVHKSLECMVGGGWYYHDIADDPMSFRLEISSLYEYPMLNNLGLYCRADGEAISFESATRIGGTLSVGLRFHGRERRKPNIALVFFNKPHQGQYYFGDEKGVGAQMELEL